MNELACWAIVPAAGIGRRMGTEIPKQYLLLGGVPVIQHSLEVLLAHPCVKGAVVALAEHDQYWDKLQLDFEKPVMTTPGGASRRESVLNALGRLRLTAHLNDPVLVHDAARPCLRHLDIDRLISAVGDDASGGLLATRASDTLHRADAEGRLESSVDREGIWLAQTPQLFRLGKLFEALTLTGDSEPAVTDEASAMILAGARPMVVEGHADNIKITQPADLSLAEYFLKGQQRL